MTHVNGVLNVVLKGRISGGIEGALAIKLFDNSTGK